MDNDYCVSFDGMSRQIPGDEYRHHYMRTSVRIHRYVDDTLVLFHDPCKLAAFSSNGVPCKERQVQGA